jgi:hypothetical protein
MKRIIGLALASVVCMAWVTFAAPTQSIDAQPAPFLASYFASHTVSQQVTITARSGQVLAVLEVPIGIMLSVHLSKGEFTGPNEKTGEATFSGDVSIRTRPRGELVAGAGLRNQMMNAPLRLDVQDALVVVLAQKR